MALFPQYSRDFTFNGKTFTNLIVSEGDAPAEKLIPAAVENNNVKFQYNFGPNGQKNVVIPKGKILEPGEPEWDFESEHYVQTVKIASPNSRKAIGVNAHNVYQRVRDRFNGNLVTVITRNYIEVPYIDTTGLDAQGVTALLHSINYGVAYGSLAPGDFVKVGEYGNFVKWNPQTITQDPSTKDITVSGDTPDMIVGQVWAVETNLPPAGFLQYFLDMDNAAYTEYLKNISYVPSPGTVYTNRGTNQVNSPGSYGTLDLNFTLKPFSGIPFLTDGYFMAKKDITGITLANDGNGTFTDPHVEYARVNDSTVASIAADGTVTINDYRKAFVAVKLKDKLAAPGDGFVKVTINDTEYNADTNPNIVHVDYVNNTVVIYFNENVTGATVTIDATLIVNPIAGIPSGWDFERSLGAVRILLMR